MPQSPGLSQREHEAAILGTLRRELGETKYDRWLGNASASVQAGEHGQDSQSVVIEVDNAFAARWVETKFIPELRVACKGIRSERKPPWRICGRQDDSVESTECSPADGAKDSTGTPRSAGKSSQSQPSTEASKSKWNPSRGPSSNHQIRHSHAGPMAAYRQLEHFVEGPSNQLAYRSVCRLLEDPQHASPMSPLFLHGDCGVGKTHLLQGAVRAASAQFSRIRYYSAEQFTNEYIRAVREHDLERFRQQLRTLDLLAIDDVHFFSHKEGTQNEFLHMLDACLLHGTKLLLAGDGHPNRFKAFSRALSSRCVSGMVVHIESPDVTTRLAIVNHLANRRGLRL
ncbi:MAG: DnaA/Hda family protein, partial [Phycisphaerales bacterium]|nr:DnaA/Hda family protein [Phycisphaerales bacterium]